MNESISLRISRIIDELFNGNKSEFARKIGISESSVRSYLASTVPKADVLEKIAKGIAVSCEWLVLGRGDMMLSLEDKSISHDRTTVDQLLALLKEKDAKIEEQARVIGRLEKELEILGRS